LTKLKILKLPLQKAIKRLDRLGEELNDIVKSATNIEELTNKRKHWIKKVNKELERIGIDETLNESSIAVVHASDLFSPRPKPDVNELKNDSQKFLRQLDQFKKVISNSDLYDDPRSGKVFVIHGHGDRKPVEEALEELGLEPVVLIEEAGGSKTIIEKLEKYAEDVDFAVALFTPDDQGRKNGVRKYHDRARQNVILETGFFLAAKGREYVCILKSESVSLADMSDLQGIITIDYGESTNWKAELKKELEAADVI